MIDTKRWQRGKDDPMNPNLTVGYMSAQAKQHEVDRGATRGWLAEQAAIYGSDRRSDLTDPLKRLLAAISEATRRLFRGAAAMDVPTAAAPLELDRIG
jgi:hypothetical protein